MLTYYLSIIDTDEEKSKFEKLYVKYRKMMFYVANKVLFDESLAEDAVQQTFLKIIENFANIEDADSSKTKSYIYTLTRNTSINLYHTRKKHSTISIDEIENYIIIEANPQSDKLDDFSRAVLMLPVIYQEVLTLKYIQDFSNTDIAQILNITEATVRKRLERARDKLQEVMEKRGQENVL